MKIVFSLLFLLTACVPSQSANQAPQPLAPLAPGDRLRITHDARCCASPSIGVVQSISRDSIVLQSAEGNARLTIARSNIFQIQRWNHHETRMVRGSLLGLLAGAAVGGIVGYESGCAHCDGDWRPLGAYMGVLVGGLAGLLAGLFAGSHYGFWETIS